MSDDGSDGSPPRPVRRKIKKVMVLSSASESESDESVVIPSTHRKRMRVVSDDGSSSSSSGGSAVVARRRRALRALRDSDSDSSASEQRAPPADASLRPSSGFASDSSEGNSDKCSICLLRFKEQEIGTPESCEHIFCLDCITEWSKNVNTCPVDRMTFNSIVVRARIGGRVLRTDPVKVVERRPSVDVLVVEDPTPCEVCGSTDNEETMLLCDGCDLGYHMQCLTPPLTEVPVEQWLCPNCDDLLDVIHISELDELFTDLDDLDFSEGPRMVPLRQPRHYRRSARFQSGAEQPSTSAAGAGAGAGPSTSRGRAPPRARAPPRRLTAASAGAAPKRRKPKRRRARTVIIEYEVEGNGKFPITKTVKRKVKKRKSRRTGRTGRTERTGRTGRTAARRAHVRASVRARLAESQQAGSSAQWAGSAGAVCELGARRVRAGITALSLFGDPHSLDYFSDEDTAPGSGPGPAPGLAAAARPAASAVQAYRQQARRKRVSLPSPPHASSAPDLLSSILDSQARLHSRRAVLALGAGGQLDISLPPPRPAASAGSSARPDGRIDVNKPEDATRKVPAYGGGGGGGGGHGGGRAGGWGGGYRGGRVPPAAPHQQHYAGAPPPALAPRPRPPPPADYRRRIQPPFPDYYDRPRRPENGNGRGGFGAQHPRGGGGGRYSSDASWRGGLPAPPQPSRHSFGGFDNDPLDMRTAPPAPAFTPLPQPPLFQFGKDNRPDEDEEVADLVIDTEKYDPTEPTNDDDEEATEPPPPVPPREPTPPPPPPALAASVGVGVDAGALASVSATVLDTAVRQVLEEHKSLLEQTGGPGAGAGAEGVGGSDGDSDGDCPNFSIYSATSVHIAAASLDPHSQRVTRRCPITTTTRSPIKIKLNTPALIKRPLSLYDDEPEPEPEQPDQQSDHPPEPLTPDKQPDTPDTHPDTPDTHPDTPDTHPDTPDTHPDTPDTHPDTPEESEKPEDDNKIFEDKEVDDNEDAEKDERISKLDDIKEPETPQTPKEDDKVLASQAEEEDEEPPEAEEAPLITENGDKSDGEPDEGSEKELRELEAGVEKMTESISETEDERSYTPCLDENKSKDTSLEDKGIEGLDTELISDEEANDMFSDEQEPASPPSPAPHPPSPVDDGKAKKKKDSKKDGKDKKSKSKKSEIAFKKLSKSGKERNYRDKDRDKEKDKEGKEKNKKERSDERRARRREKRKDLERYDVRTVVSEKRKRVKDAFGRDVSPPRSRSRSASVRSPPPPRKLTLTPRRRSASVRRRSASPRKRSVSPRRRSISPRRRSISPRRRSISPRRRSGSPRRRSMSPRRRSVSPRRSPPLRRKSVSPLRRKSISPLRRKSISPLRRKSGSPGRRKSGSPARGRKRRSPSRSKKRRRSASPKAKGKKKKRARADSKSRRKSPKRKRKRSRSASPGAVPPPPGAAWSGGSVDSRLLSPRTPPPAPRRRRHRRAASPPAKEVFTSGDNILVSVSFKEQQRESVERRRRRAARKERRRRRADPAAAPAAKPVAIIDLERSPFRELTPSPKNVIVLSDSDHAEPPAAPPAPAPEPPPPHVGPKTPPEPPAPAPDPPQPEGAGAPGPATPPDSPDAYDPFEPTRSPSPAPPAAPAPAPAPAHMTLETAQRTNMSADEVLDRRPLEPVEKVMALLQSTRDVSPEPVPAEAPPAAPPAPRVVPVEARPQAPKLFLAKPSPIKSNPVKPMQATKISRLPLPLGVAAPRLDELDSPYSPGSSDFGDLFDPAPDPPPPRPHPHPHPHPNNKHKHRRHHAAAAKVPVKLNKKKGKQQVGVKIDEDNLKILDDLPSSAVEMQVKSKFLKKLNRQERVVEEVKLVLKPHYNKKHVTKDQYKDILRRAVPKICHNKSGEINPTKIQALVEAYVKKFRKKHKLGLA